MGNHNVKSNEQKLYTAEEMKVLEAAYRAVSSHEKCTKENLMVTWGAIVDEHLAQCTSNYLYTSGQQTLATIPLMRFSEPYYIVERGTIDEKLNFVISSFEKSDTKQLAIKQLELYVVSVLRSYIAMQSEQSTEVYESWKKHGYQSAERTIFAFAKGITRSLAIQLDHCVDFDKLEQWLQVNPTFLIIWKEVFAYLYSKSAGKTNKLGNSLPTMSQVMPLNEGLTIGLNYTPILDIPHVMFVNSQLPTDRRHKWRLLFSSVVMGESFSTMLGKILNKGPTLVICEDEDRYIFGGYAPHSWALKPVFVGDDSSVLFTLSPAMRSFTPTGYNDHYQYMNLNQQTMPNGLGMGGQFNFWGLWIDSDYGLGHSSESCTTFRDYVQLSKRKDFKIRNLEVWGIGDEPKHGDDSDDDDGESRHGSVLDKHLADRVMLELAGKKMHSDGLREPDPDMGL